MFIYIYTHICIVYIHVYTYVCICLPHTYSYMSTLLRICQTQTIFTPKWPRGSFPSYTSFYTGHPLGRGQQGSSFEEPRREPVRPFSGVKDILMRPMCKHYGLWTWVGGGGRLLHCDVGRCCASQHPANMGWRAAPRLLFEFRL